MPCNKWVAPAIASMEDNQRFGAGRAEFYKLFVGTAVTQEVADLIPTGGQQVAVASMAIQIQYTLLPAEVTM